MSAGDRAMAEFESLIDGDHPDPFGVYARLRDEAPVAWSEAMRAWIVTRHADVTRVFEDEEHFGPRFADMSSSAIYGRTILHMSGSEHRRKAAILGRRLRNQKRLATDMYSLVLHLVHECGDRLVDAPEAVDLKGSLTSIVPLEVIGELMDLHEATAFPEWYHRIVAASASNVTGDPQVHARGVTARDELFEFITPKIAAKREEPADDLLSTLASTEFEGEQLADDEVRSFCAFLMSAGIETTDRAMVNLLVELIAEPGLWETLRNDPELITPAVAEGLRYRPPVHGAIREAREQVELGGASFMRGERVFLVLASANRDEAVFANADAFDIRRFSGNAAAQFTQAAAMRSFGGGVHLCTGSLLAKVELEEMLRYLLDRCEAIEFANGLPEDHGFFLRSPVALPVRLHPAAAA